MKLVTIWNLGTGAVGTVLFTGTSSTEPATPSQGPVDVKVGVKDNDFFLGQISNLSGIDVQLNLMVEWQGDFRGIHAHDLRAYEAIDVRMPLKFLNVIVNGSALIHGMGVIVRPESKEEEAILFANAGLIERLTDGRYYRFPTYDHTDINTATTTTLATPVAGRTIRVYKITVATDGAAAPTLAWTDSDGTSNPNAIGTLRFAGEGVFVYDFGDKGLECPNGADGLLRVTSNNTAVLDIDVISEDVLNQ